VTLIAHMAASNDLTADVLAKLAEHKVDLTDEEHDLIADASRAYHGECLTWYAREGADWVLYGIPNWPESYFWDEFPSSVYFRCSAELRDALKDLIGAHKAVLVARWRAAETLQRAVSENVAE